MSYAVRKKLSKAKTRADIIKKIKKARLNLGLDRPSTKRVLTSKHVRRVVKQTKIVRHRSRSLRIVGGVGRRLVSCLRVFLKRKSYRVQTRLRFKYRLKLVRALRKYRSVFAVQCTLRPYKALHRARRRRAHNERSLLRRSRTLRGTRTFSKEYAFRVRPVHSPRQRRSGRDPRLSKKWLKARKSYLNEQPRVRRPSRAFRLFNALHYRYTRAYAAKVNITKHRRWWLTKKFKKLRRSYRAQKRARRRARSCSKKSSLKLKRGLRSKSRKKCIATAKSNKFRKKLKFSRRRVQGRRFYAGFFGRRRWRAERKDKFFGRRARKQAPIARVLIQRTIQSVAGRRSTRMQQSYRFLKALALHTPELVVDNVRSHNRRYLYLRNEKVFVTQDDQLSVSEQPNGLQGAVGRGRTHIRCFLSSSARLLARKGLPTSSLVDVPLLRCTKEAYRLRGRRDVHNQQLFRSALSTFRTTLEQPSNAQQAGVYLRNLAQQRRLRSSRLRANTLQNSLQGELLAQLKEYSPFPGATPWAKLVQSNLSQGCPVLRTAGATKQPQIDRCALLTAPSPALVIGRKATRKLRPRSNNFLQRRLSTVKLAPDSTLFNLLTQRRRQRELRFYHKRSRIRLPRTKMTRKRRRKGGLVTFTRNSLKRPETLGGQRNLLLPPVTSYIAAASLYSTRQQVIARNMFVPTTQREDELPQFWRRSHTRANIKAISLLRHRQYAKHKKRYLRWQAVRVKQLQAPLKRPKIKKLTSTRALRSDAPSLIRQEVAMQAVIAASLRSRTVGAGTKSNKSKRLGRCRQKVQPKTGVQSRGWSVKRTAGHLTSAVSRATEWAALLQKKAQPAGQRCSGLWQMRSVQKMLTEERALSAWSPQLSIRNRRAHFPRIKGVPVPRRWLTFKAKRDRRYLNAKLLARSLPQRRYIDYTPIKLQYYSGSVGSAGYARFRRVHRQHSKHNRWWRPNKVAIPFVHPLSRRALNTKRYTRIGFSPALAPKNKTLTRAVKDVRAIFLHSKFPPRAIPWRNFRYARPRRGRIPKTLQRWTFTKRSGKTGRILPGKERPILRRTSRELRLTTRSTFSRNVWKSRRWVLIDNTTVSGTAAGYLFAAMRAMPSSAWHALQRRAGSPALYAALQGRILKQFRQWALKESYLTPQPTNAAFQRARLVLINFLTSGLNGYLACGQKVLWHKSIRLHAFDKKVSTKALKFLQLRTLPKLDSKNTTNSVLQRERSGLYRRWLQGVEGATKRARFGYAPTSRSRYTANVAFLFGRRRARFPASGRRYKSYDALLHAFVRKAGPSQFRRVSSLRFKLVLPSLAYDFRENLLTTTANRGLNRRRKLARAVAQAGYLSSPWRELLTFRASNVLNPLKSAIHTTSKRRFLALPLRALRTASTARTLSELSPYKQQMRIIRAGVLRRALRRRRLERPFVDLRHSTIKRRLPKEQASRPWKVKRAKKRRSAAKTGPYSQFALYRRPLVPGYWTLVHLSAVGPKLERIERAPLPPVLASGEHLLTPVGKLRKNIRAFRGFLLPVNAPKKRKLRKQQRNSDRRQRVSRRPRRAGRLAALRKRQHWSENKDRGFRVKTFNHKRLRYAQAVGRALPGKLKTRYGAFLPVLKRSSRLLPGRASAFSVRNRAQYTALQNKKHLVSVPAPDELLRRSFLRRYRCVRRRFATSCNFLSNNTAKHHARDPKSTMRDNGLSTPKGPDAKSFAPRHSAWKTWPWKRKRSRRKLRWKTPKRIKKLRARGLQYKKELRGMLKTKRRQRRIVRRHQIARIEHWFRAYALLPDVTLRRSAIAAAKVNVHATQASRAVDRLTSAAAVIAPLWFQRSTTRVVRSQTTKQKDALADIAAKEGRYRLTAQYVESLTSFIPELMNYMLSRRLQKTSQQITYSAARHLVRNIYWSLRVYLNVDPFDFRFMVKDKRPAARLRLFESISDFSEAQKTEQPQRAALRYRFQPGKVLRAPNTMRFRGDWLRAFFPAKHALYQENPEDYGKFLFKTRRIRRLRIGPRGIATWVTQAQNLSHETRARQLLTLRFSRTRRRFETVLQTTRRVPQAEIVAHPQASIVRSPFFKRQFSTYANRSLVVSSKWIHRQKRFIALEEGWRAISPLIQIAVRNRALLQLDSRGRTNYITTQRPAVNNSFLDSRFVRAKSGRSRQYLIRVPRKVLGLSKKEKFANIQLHTRVLKKKRPIISGRKHRWTRAMRRTAARSLVSPWQQQRHLALKRLRSVQQARRVWAVSVLRSKSAVKGRAPQLRTTKKMYLRGLVLPRRSIIALPCFRRRKFLSKVLSRFRAGALGLGAALRRCWWRKCRIRARRRRRRMKRREARARRRELRALLKELKLDKEPAQKFAPRVQQKKIKRSYAQRLALRKWRRAVSRKNRERRRVRRLKFKRLHSAQAVRNRSLGGITLFRKKQKAALLGRALLMRPTLRRTVRLPSSQRSTNIRISARFVSNVGRRVIRSIDFARACALFTKLYRQTPFETHRPRLWNNLTQRWMKKYRIGRYWLRDAGRWLRDPWLSEIVACDMTLRPDRFGGELRGRLQQVGEYVPAVDARGRDIPRRKAAKERHTFQNVLSGAQDYETKKTNRILKKGPITDRLLTRQRLKISQQVLRKPQPTLRLANYEYRDVIRQHKENKAKSAKQKEEEEQLRVKAYWARKAKKLPPEKEKRLPLKHPANLWLPHIIWKEIQRRIRKFEWRESDEVFFRKGFRNAFRFYPNERRKSPWLEALMYTRATYSTRLAEFRRRQYPHEQKKFKWLQRVRKTLYPGRGTRYIKGRRWPQLCRYNQKLHYTLFNFRDRGAARRHFKKRSRRTRPAVSAFVSISKGLTDRLDLTCFQMGVAPSIYWARIVTEFGLLRVNGVTIYSPAYRIKSSDIIYPNWDRIARFQHFFKPQLRAREEYQRRNRVSTAFYPTNMEYHRGIRALVYKHAPDLSDLRRSSRIRPAYLQWFRLDSAK